MSISRYQLTVSNLIAVVAIAVGMGGCAGLSGFSPPVALVVFLLTLTVGGLVGCQQTDQQTDQQNQTDETWTVPPDSASDVPDVRDTANGEGRWVKCCRRGEIDTCFCKAGWVCNYGNFRRCGGNKCVSGWGDAGCPTDVGDTEEPPDTARDTEEPPDTTRDTTETRDTSRGEGRWVQCCRNGEIDSCYCPANTACNFGRFTHCGGDKCTTGFGDAGCPADTGGDTAGRF